MMGTPVLKKLSRFFFSIDTRINSHIHIITKPTNHQAFEEDLFVHLSIIILCFKTIEL